MPDAVADILEEKWDHEKSPFALPPLMMLVSSLSVFNIFAPCP